MYFLTESRVGTGRVAGDGSSIAGYNETFRALYVADDSNKTRRDMVAVGYDHGAQARLSQLIPEWIGVAG
jgi:hypothetical protein